MIEILVKILIEVLNMSIWASLIAFIVILIRFPLKKAPKIFSYALWGIVFFRLVCPFRFEIPVSLIVTNVKVIPQTIVTLPVPQLSSNITNIEKPISTFIKSNERLVDINTGTNLRHLVLSIGVTIWLCGLVLLMLYVIFSYIRMKRQVYDATLISGNIFESDKIPTAFVLGFIRPKIYLSMLANDRQSEYILKHEQVHIRRGDYLIKPIAFFILAIHWFNPVIWISYYLMSVDIEMSCDESVLRSTNEDIRQAYSISLVSLYARKPGLLSPLAFGGGNFKNLKERVKNVINFKKTPKWSILLCSVLLVSFTTVGVMATPSQNVVENTKVNVSASPRPENIANELSTVSTAKDITIKIENVVKNKTSAKIKYSINDKNNKLGENVDVHYIINGDVSGYSSAYKNEDGKLYGAFDVVSIDGFTLDNLEMQIDQLRYNQLIGQNNMKTAIKLSNLKAPIVIKNIGSKQEWEEALKDFHAQNPAFAQKFNYNELTFLQPDEYNYKLPIKSGEGEAWVSNIGVVKNKLHVQVKTLNPDIQDGVIAYDVQPIVTDKKGESLVSVDQIYGTFSIGENGKIYFFNPVNPKYEVNEYVYELGKNNIGDLDLGFNSVPSSYLNGKWAVSFNSKNIKESTTKKLTGLEAPSNSIDKMMLESLTVTPLYFELSVKMKDSSKPFDQAFYPTTVITYKDGQKTEYVGYEWHFATDSGEHRLFKLGGDKLIEFDKIQSIKLDGLEIFNIKK